MKKIRKSSNVKNSTKLINWFFLAFQRLFLEKVLFVKEIINHPRFIGAALPSSKYLARSMAEHIPKSSEGYIVELGAGTGAITKQILSTGIDPKRLMLIEISPRLVIYLRKRFPNINVIEGNAEDLDLILGNRIKHIDAIVSSLPLKSLPKKVENNITIQIHKILSYKGLYIQFTYGFFLKKKMPFKDLKQIHSKIVWKNFPPAAVNVAIKGFVL